MSNLKKLLCNPPAEMVAMHGDPKVAGMFSGGGDGLEYIKDEAARAHFAHRITDVEEEYMNARKEAHDNAVSAMDEIFHEMVDGQGFNPRDLEKALDHLAPKEGKNFPKKGNS